MVEQEEVIQPRGILVLEQWIHQLDTMTGSDEIFVTMRLSKKDTVWRFHIVNVRVPVPEDMAAPWPQDRPREGKGPDYYG